MLEISDINVIYLKLQTTNSTFETLTFHTPNNFAYSDVPPSRNLYEEIFHRARLYRSTQETVKYNGSFVHGIIQLSWLQGWDFYPIPQKTMLSHSIDLKFGTHNNGIRLLRMQNLRIFAVLL